jgi:5-formyltetrahydrofolate cyclo-ligase
MIRGRIAELDAAARQAVSLDICRKLAALAREKDYRRVAVFAARPGEVDLLPLLDMMPEREWYFPLVHEGRRLSFHRVCHGGEFVTGSWDIREPGPACPELHAGELDLIVLPGAAFTRDGRRLGYGGGFYDTLLAGPARGVPLVGVCFPCQLLDDLPVEPHDKKVDMVVIPGME